MLSGELLNSCAPRSVSFHALPQDEMRLFERVHPPLSSTQRSKKRPDLIHCTVTRQCLWEALYDIKEDSRVFQCDVRLCSHNHRTDHRRESFYVLDLGLLVTQNTGSGCHSSKRKAFQCVAAAWLLSDRAGQSDASPSRVSASRPRFSSTP